MRSLTHFNYVTFNQAALRAVLKPQNIPSSAQTKQISVSFVCVYASSTLPFIDVSNRFTRCLDHYFFALFDRCFNLFHSITKLCSTRAKLFCIYLLPLLASVNRPQGPLRNRCVMKYFLAVLLRLNS